MNGSAPVVIDAEVIPPTAPSIKRHTTDPATEKSKRVTKALVRQGRPVDSENGGLAFAARFLKGGRQELVEIARCCTDAKVMEVVKQWDELSPTSKRKTKLENICEGVEITPGEFLGRVAQHAHDTGLDLSKLILGISHPRVLQRSVKNALTQNGFKDRELLMKASGFLPTPGGMNVNVKNLVNAQAALNVEQPKGLPSFEESAIVSTKAVRSDS